MNTKYSKQYVIAYREYSSQKNIRNVDTVIIVLVDRESILAVRYGSNCIEMMTVHLKNGLCSKLHDNKKILLSRSKSSVFGFMKKMNEQFA